MFVGHSGAGLLLPAIADAMTAKVAALVFVDAFLPPARGSTRLLPSELMLHLRAPARGGVLSPWSKWFGEEAMRELVPDEALRSSLEEEMTCLPLSYFEADVSVPEAWTRGRCAYLLFSAGTYGKSAARTRANGWAVREIPGAHHLLMVTEPVAVTVALLDLERQLLTATWRLRRRQPIEQNNWRARRFGLGSAGQNPPGCDQIEFITAGAISTPPILRA